MSANNEQGMGRRDFLRRAAVAGGCLGLGLRAALAEAQEAGKPLLTEKGLNALVPANKPSGKELEDYRRTLEEAGRDPKAFVRKRFHLTKEQERKLDSLTASDLEAIRRALETARAKDQRLRVILVPEGERPRSVPALALKVSTEVGPTYNERTGWSVEVKVKAEWC